MNSIGAVVLAGGQSRRMGRAKAWLMLNGEPLLLRMVRVMASTCSSIVVVGREGIGLPRMPERVQVVQDHSDWNGGGPLLGLYSGLFALQKMSPNVELAYVSGCDNPRLSEEHVQKMLSVLEHDTKCEFQYAWPVDEQGRGNPLCSTLRVRNALAQSRGLLDSGERRLSILFENSRTLTVNYSALPDPDVLNPCNTPEHWELLQGKKPNSP